MNLPMYSIRSFDFENGEQDVDNLDANWQENYFVALYMLQNLASLGPDVNFATDVRTDDVQSAC